MALENILSRMGLDTKQLTDRYAEYGPPMHDQHIFYGYEPSSPLHGHAVPTKHNYVSGSHKNNAAMSALTLLAFLFFLNILQQCLKDHMTAMNTPQVTIMSSVKETEDNFAKKSFTNKFDKTGTLHTDKNNFQRESLLSLKEGEQVSVEENEFESRLNSDDASQKTLLKIKTAEHKPQNSAQEHKIVKNNANQTFKYAGFYDEYEN
ncbi:unnamed protein product [Parnassius mnemosyne]|uniref:Uncharacterized protein n=1 Tax=Parnassius mnemosyne TaxID=213953 RepID=A0AAV1KIE5_9NEOP